MQANERLAGHRVRHRVAGGGCDSVGLAAKAASVSCAQVKGSLVALPVRPSTRIFMLVCEFTTYITFALERLRVLRV